MIVLVVLTQYTSGRTDRIVVAYTALCNSAASRGKEDISWWIVVSVCLYRRANHIMSSYNSAIVSTQRVHRVSSPIRARCHRSVLAHWPQRNDSCRRTNHSRILDSRLGRSTTFCHAVLCKRGLRHGPVSVCLSVRMSVSFLYCIIKLFHLLCLSWSDSKIQIDLTIRNLKRMECCFSNANHYPRSVNTISFTAQFMINKILKF